MARLVEWVAEERPPGYVIPVVGGTTESRFWAHGIILQAMHLRDLAFGHRKFKSMMIPLQRLQIKQR
ncbi:hypothetical protein QC762_0108780 [Podospora pseudocomata]|uniref:Uncharacterized protein n=1 Tax=Podospora pseudocomata TaxID=2093779 RepID=A0ABR0G3N0_9PEZI|nr:hypothetical protein QC762_0108780 [Podospora pseudocomata]